MSDLRAELEAARDRGLISLPRYLAELSKLEIAEEQGESLSQAAATPSEVGGGGGGGDSRSDNNSDNNSSELLVDEDGVYYEPYPGRTPSPLPSLASLHADEDDADDDEEDGDESAGPQSPAASRLQAGLSATHTTLGDVKIVKMGTADDFCNADHVYISYQRRKMPGRGRRGTVMETAHKWVMPDTLTVAEPAPVALSPHEERATAREQREQVALSPPEERAAGREQRAQLTEELPERAEHERTRKLPMRKAGAAPKEASGSKRKSMKTARERCAQFPDHPLVPDGEMVRCRACKRKYENSWSSINQHVSNKKHKDNMQSWSTRADDDKALKAGHATHPSTLPSPLPSPSCPVAELACDTQTSLHPSPLPPPLPEGPRGLL